MKSNVRSSQKRTSENLVFHKSNENNTGKEKKKSKLWKLMEELQLSEGCLF